MQPTAAGTYGMGISGGSDCHGTRKMHISMGTGCGNLAIPYSGLEELKSCDEKPPLCKCSPLSRKESGEHFYAPKRGSASMARAMRSWVRRTAVGASPFKRAV